MSEAARKLRIRMANNGRNPANGNMGIRVGSDLHLAEMLLKERDALLTALKLCKPFCWGHQETPEKIERYEKVAAAIAMAEPD